MDVCIPFDLQEVRFAANLAVFDIALFRSGAGIDHGLIRFTAAGALELSLHVSDIVPESNSNGEKVLDKLAAIVLVRIS